MADRMKNNRLALYMPVVLLTEALDIPQRCNADIPHNLLKFRAPIINVAT